MNTRRKLIQPKPNRPSTHWHLMNESYHSMFIPERREHIEYWYNMGATAPQRDNFRSICLEIFLQDPNRPDPTFTSPYTETVRTEEARVMLKNYGLVLTELAKQKARAWILHDTDERRRNAFRDVFTGCQTVFRHESVMHKDFVPPDSEYYPTDRTYFQRSVDWTSTKARGTMQKLEEQRRGAHCPTEERQPTIAGPSARPRFTKPKNQFDGVNPLSTLGLSNISEEEAVKQLKEKRKAHQEADTYYIDDDGCTVYKVGPRLCNPAARPSQGGGIISTVTAESIGEWKVKICD